MEKNLLLIIIILLTFLIILLVGAVIWAIFFLMKRNQVVQDPYHPEIRKRLTENSTQKSSSPPAAYCSQHPELPAEGSCGICHDLFCQSCLKPYKTHNFCKEHLSEVMNFEWVDVKTVKSSPDNPEIGVHLIDFKEDLWKTHQIPSYVETHYKLKLEAEKDEVESFVVLFVKVTDKNKVLDFIPF